MKIHNDNHLCKTNGYLGIKECPQCYEEEITRLQTELDGMKSCAKQWFGKK